MLRTDEPKPPTADRNLRLLARHARRVRRVRTGLLVLGGALLVTAAAVVILGELERRQLP